MDDNKRKKHLSFIDTRKMFTLAGAGIIIVVFYLFIGKLGIVLAGIGSFIRALSPIIIGVVISFLLNPIVNKLRVSFRTIFTKLFKKSRPENIKKASDVIAVIITIIVFLALITALFWVLIPSLYDSIYNFYENIDKYSNNVEKYARKVAKNNTQIINIINNYLGDIETTIKELLTKKLLPNMDSYVKAISSGIVGGVKLLLNVVIGIIAAVYILLSKDKFSAQGKKVIYAIFKRETGNRILEGLEFMDGVFSGFINGKIVDSIIIGIICFIFCTIVQMPYAILISVIIGVTNIIPFFGPFIGAIPSAVLVLFESPKMCLVFIIFVIILQQLDGNIIGPLILGDSTGLSSFWVLFAIVVCGNLFGFVGMILGVPTFACLYALLTRILRNGLNKNGLDNDTEYFMALRGFDESGEPVRGPKRRIENSRNKQKREKRLEQLQHSKELLDKVTHHEKSDFEKNNNENNGSDKNTEENNASDKNRNE